MNKKAVYYKRFIISMMSEKISEILRGKRVSGSDFFVIDQIKNERQECRKKSEIHSDEVRGWSFKL